MTKLIGKLCNSYNLTSFDLYPNKQKDLMGRELTVATFNYIPFIYLGKLNWIFEIIFFKLTLYLEKSRGAELSMMNTFIQKYNYTRKLLISSQRWGEIFKNLTGTGAKYDVYSGKADVGVGKR